MYNKRIESSEITQLNHKSNLPETFRLELTLYTSLIVEDHQKKTKYNQGQIDPYDLCATGHINVIRSQYYDQTDDQELTCQREILSEYSDAYHINFEIRDIPGGSPNEGNIRFEIDSENNRIFHFFKWKFMSIWEERDKIPTAFSEIESIMTPQDTHSLNKNITSAFKGPETTHVVLELTPTSYVSEPDDYSYSGYRTYFDHVVRGGVVNRRSMLLSHTPQGFDNKGLDIEFVTTTSNKIYQVRVIRIRSFIEIMAFILGSIGGMVFIARVLKSWMGDKEYFRAKDRECDMLFGVANATIDDPEFQRQIEMANRRNKQSSSFDRQGENQDVGDVEENKLDQESPVTTKKKGGKPYEEFDD